MNTPAHALINLLLLARKPRQNISHKRSAMIIAGALLPDLVIIVFYAWHLLLVVHAVNKVTLSRSTIVFGKARSAGNGMPFPRGATQSKNDCAAALRKWLC